MNKSTINTEAAPAAIGPYSQAVKMGDTVYLSGQIPLDPQSMTLVEGGIEPCTHQVFKNLKAVCEAAGGSLQDILKLNIFLTQMDHFATVNGIMQEYFMEPYPARAAIAVAELPKGALIEMDAIMGLA